MYAIVLSARLPAGVTNNNGWRKCTLHINGQEKYNRLTVGVLILLDDFQKCLMETNIITAVDYATAWPVAKAAPKADAETIADFLHDEIYLHYGAPKEIITDRGPNLWAPAMEAYVSKLNLKHRGTTSFHPRTNGKVESFNGVVGHMLTKYLIGKSRKLWDRYLDQALFAARIRTHTTTRYSPFYLVYG